MKRSFRKILVLSVLAAGLAVAIPLAVTQGTNRASGAPITTVGSSAITTVSLPSGYQRPASLAAASDGTAWFWSNSSTKSTLFHWNPNTGTLNSVDLGDPSSLGLITGIENAIAIDSAGRVWVGANQSLVSYNPQDGTISHLILPASPTDSQLTAIEPAQLANAQSITAMSADADGDVAIASQNSNVVQVLQTASNGFTQIALPVGTEVTDLAYDVDGSLGAAISSVSGGTVTGSVLIVHSNSSQTSVTGVSTQHLAATPTGFLASDAQTLVSESGTTQPVPTSAGVSSLSSDAASVGGFSSQLSDGKIAYTSPSGLVITDSNSAELVQLPQYSCTTGGGMRNFGSTSSTTSTTLAAHIECSEQASSLVGENSGIFFVLTAPTSTVGFLHA